MGLFPAKYTNPDEVFRRVGTSEQDIQNLNDLLNPFAEYADQIGQIPFYQTGARAFIKIGGRAQAVCQNIRWKINYTATPIHTVDSQFPWDIDVGAVSINASMTSIMDPTKGPEADGLFHIMQSSAHQPMVELQVLDKLGTSLFFARGMFVGVNGNVARGQMSTWDAQFIGVAYQHYVAQSFKPYESVAGATSTLLDGLQNITSDLSGGLL